jgi:hypothetical protein
MKRKRPETIKTFFILAIIFAAGGCGGGGGGGGGGGDGGSGGSGYVKEGKQYTTVDDFVNDQILCNYGCQTGINPPNIVGHYKNNLTVHQTSSGLSYEMNKTITTDEIFRNQTTDNYIDEIEFIPGSGSQVESRGQFIRGTSQLFTIFMFTKGSQQGVDCIQYGAATISNASTFPYGGPGSDLEGIEQRWEMTGKEGTQCDLFPAVGNWKAMYGYKAYINGNLNP